METLTVTSHLQFLSFLPAERLQGEAEVVRLWERSQVKVVLGIDAGRHVDVELQQLQKLSLQFVPGRMIIQFLCQCTPPVTF